MTSPTTVQVRLQIRADTAANWTANDPVLLANELGRETDTGKFKIGNGSTPWSSLAYQPWGGLITNGDIASNAEIAVSKLADGAERQLLQTDAAGTGVEWTSNVDVPGTLDVTGAATFDGAATVTGLISANGKVSFPLGTAALPSIYPGSDVNTGIYSPGEHQVAISTNGAQALYINADGDILVADGNRMEIDEVRARDGAGLKLFDDAGAGIFVKDGGNVGIGTSTVDERLHVVGNIKGVNSSGQGIQLINTTTPYIQSVGTSNINDLQILAKTLDFQTGSTYSTNAALFIDSSQRVGIGTTSPGANLHVIGASKNQLRLGTAGTEQYEIGRDASTGLLWFYGSQTGYTGYVFDGINGERARIDSSGRLLVGTSSARSNIYVGGTNPVPNVQFEGAANNYNAGLSLINYSASGFSPLLTLGLSLSNTAGTNAAVNADKDYGIINFVGNDGTNFRSGAYILASCDGAVSTGDLPTRLVFSTNPGAPATSPTERMRISNTGTFSLGSSGGTGGNFVRVTTPDSNPIISCYGTATTNSNISYLLYGGGGANWRFGVGYGGTVYATTTTISSTSDIRLKENVRDIEAGLAEILALQPRSFDWKEGKGADIKNARGFVAQEFEQVFPDLVDEWPGDAPPEGEEPYKGLRQDLIPVLVKAIQEQQAMIVDLQAEVAALKGA